MHSLGLLLFHFFRLNFHSYTFQSTFCFPVCTFVADFDFVFFFLTFLSFFCRFIWQFERRKTAQVELIELNTVSFCGKCVLWHWTKSHHFPVEFFNPFLFFWLIELFNNIRLFLSHSFTGHSCRALANKHHEDWHCGNTISNISDKLLCGLFECRRWLLSSGGYAIKSGSERGEMLG